MNCPVCNMPLTMTDRQGVEIDYCQKCRGVWLDRGELDKIIERSVGVQTQSNEPRYEDRSGYSDNSNRTDRGFHSEHRDDYHHPHKKKKKESFLGDLFDF